MLLLIWVLTLGCMDQAAIADGVWDVPALKKARVDAVWGEPTRQDGVDVGTVHYSGESYQGKPTRVFAWYARPATGGKNPALLLVHGGGGKAFREWATHHAKRGYCAIAMDLSGNGEDGKRLADGGPDQADETKFRDFTAATRKEMWTYHAVANVLRAHTLLAGLPEVDANRVGVTGISWGGYLTCIVAGIDDRLKAAAPVYGCGFLHEDSYWKPERFDGVDAARRDRWVAAFDPSAYVGGAKCPMLFINGTNDFAYTMGSYQKTYNLVKAPKTICLRVRLPHGHIWTFAEVDTFLDSFLKGGKGLATVSAMVVEDGTAKAKVASPSPVVKAYLHYAKAEGPWQKRDWKSAPAKVENGVVSAVLPDISPLVFELAVVDERGLEVTAPHQVIGAGR